MKIPTRELSGSTVAAGVIVFLLGVVGLLQLFGVAIIPFDLAVIGVFLTTLGAILLFGAIALVGIVLIVGGLAATGPKPVERVAHPTAVTPVVLAQPVPTATTTPGTRILSDLEIVTLRYASQGRRPGEIAAATGVSESIILDKLAMLRAEGYLTDKNGLSEKGFEALRVADQRPVYPSPPP
jgi:DNA-binding CsgD family transcriptional regulator